MKKLLSILLTICVLSSSLCLMVSADFNFPYESGNSLNYLTTERYGSIVSSALYIKDDTLYRAEILSECVEDEFYEGEYCYNDVPVLRVEEYDSDYNFVSGLNVPGELESIAGFYVGQNANYLVCIQNNLEEDNSREVFRVIKYTSDWQTRLGSASVYGSNTTVPTEAGSLRFAEYGNYLYIHTCHEMYTSSDGLNHQANMTFVVDTVNMEITYNRHNVWNTSTGYVSHSFNQFIAVDESTNSIITADHGDAYPRSIALFRFDNAAGSSTLGTTSYIDVFDIAGQIGDNTTNVSMGDLTVTPNNYIVAFNSNKQGTNEYTRNIYLAIVPKNSFNENAVSIVKLTDYTEYIDCVGIPYITDIGDGKYLVTWENEYYRGTVEYVVIDENGNKLSDTIQMYGYLSDCHPIVNGDDVIWYTDTDPNPNFYKINTIDIGSDDTVTCTHEYEQSVIQEPTCTEEGIELYECTLCDHSYEETIDKVSHKDEDDDGYCDFCSSDLQPDNVEEMFVWDKELYIKGEDDYAILTVTPPEGTYISAVGVSNCYKYQNSGNTFKFDLSVYEQPNNIIFYFSDGTQADTDLFVIKDTTPVDVDIQWQGYESDNSCAYLYLDMPWSVSIYSVECDNPDITHVFHDRNASFHFNGVTTDSEVTIMLTNGQILTTTLVAPETEEEPDYEITASWSKDNYTTEDDFAVLTFEGLPQGAYITHLDISYFDPSDLITMKATGNVVEITIPKKAITNETVTVEFSTGDVYTASLTVNYPKSKENIKVVWEKDVYTVYDTTAFLTLENLPEGVSVYSCNIDYIIAPNSSFNVSTRPIFKYVEFILVNQAFQADITLYLTNGETVKTQLTVLNHDMSMPGEAKITATWDKTSYTSGAKWATVTFEGLPKGTYISKYDVTDSRLISNKNGWLTIDFLLPGVALTSDITVYFSNGSVYTTTLTVEQSPSVSRVSKGDIDGNGKITAADARKILRIAAKLEASDNFAVADYNSDNKITAADARKVLRVSAKLDAWIK